jgi:zinc-ribbon domain
MTGPARVKLYASGETIVICPKCGEDNSDSFRFCGMCGTLLEARTETRRPTGAPVPNLPQNLSPGLARLANSAPFSEPAPQATVNPATTRSSISAPSMLGLDQPATTQHELNPPSMETLREKSFSGLDSFFEPEEPKRSGGRVALLVVLLAALGVAGWWAYTNYLGATEPRKPSAATDTADTSAVPTEAPAETTPTRPDVRKATTTPATAAPQTSPPAAVPETLSEPTASEAGASNKTSDATAKPETGAPVATSTPTKIAPQEKVIAKREPIVSTRVAKAPTSLAPAADTGDAEFRKGEAYLYGRGAAENCDEAVKFLKAASAKSNAKARSTFGTMYATGHCAPRDLPTSYLWFAMALRADPNNQILEKDLSAIWNQMTPPERQMATRMKQ